MVFYIIALILSSIAGFLFPVFASYKALKTSDPTQLTPWLMYWVVFGCGLLVESWTEWFLGWIPFYYYARLLLIFYLVSPQTQGARYLYETHVHPFIEDNETHIDELIARAHERLRAAGMRYLKQSVEIFKTKVLGLPPGEPAAEAAEATPPATAQSYTQSLLARFSVPAARWTGSTTTNAGADFYNLLAGAVSSLAAASAASAASAAAAGGGGGGGGGGSAGVDVVDAISRSGSLIPADVRGAGVEEKMTFIAAQRERLNIVLGALDREARDLQREETLRAQNRTAFGMSLDGEGDGNTVSPGALDSPLQRPASGLSGFSGASGLSKSRSETDFEKIDVDSGAEEEGLRRRGQAGRTTSGGGSSWVSWGWAGSGGQLAGDDGVGAEASGAKKKK